MILPQSYTAALVLMIFSMLCLGSWANMYKLAGKWRFELFYFDFAFGVLLAAFVYAFTVGNIGYDGFNFLDDLMHAGKHQWVYGFLAGVIFNFANILLMAAVSVAGMAVAFPIGMGVALIVGVVLVYATRVGGNGSFWLLGCSLIVAAIVADIVAYRQLGVIRHEALARAGKSKSTRRPSSMKGIVIALVSGLLMGSYWPLVDKGREGDVGLGPYSMSAVFALGVFFSTFVFNIFLMNLPVEGDPLEFLDYFQGKGKQHVLGLLGGVIWSTGAMGALVAMSLPEQVPANPVMSYATVHAAPLLSAIWGLVVWREFKGSDIRGKSLAILMLVLYACGVALVSMAPQYLRQA